MQRQRAGIAFEYPLRSELPGRAQVEIVVAVLEVSKWQHDRSNEDVPVGKIGSLAIRARYRGVGRVGFRPEADIRTGAASRFFMDERARKVPH